jgi:2,3-bisphosphoglycerate-independent phosphoglycerate mutase
LDRVVQAQLEAGGEMLITADHGNAERMMDDCSHQAHTAHTMSLVPLVYISQRRAILADTGALEDVTPTMLKMMGLPQPQEMLGRPLIEFTP